MTNTWVGFTEQWRLDASQLVAMFIHLPFRGAYNLVFFATTLVLLRRRLQVGLPFVAIIVLYLLCFINTANSLQRAYNAYIIHAGSTSDYFLTNSNGRILHDVTYFLESATADALLLWRM
ncbi:hypothetical protein FRB95_012091 [Tulasnella sp. JGI-2019a]|nr:hypothetical protein FRB95_012091 [Tulasnella sp. JGI-2019a]